MIKVKTFKTGDETINDFIANVGVINNGITTSGDNITVVYRDSKYIEFGEEERLQELHAKLYQEKQTLLRCELDLAYFDTKELDETTGVQRRTLEDKKTQTENMIKILEDQLA